MKTRWLALALIATVCGVTTAAYADGPASIWPSTASTGPGGTITYHIHNDYTDQNGNAAALTLFCAPVYFDTVNPVVEPGLSTANGSWVPNPELDSGTEGVTFYPGESKMLGTLTWAPGCSYVKVVGTLPISLSAFPPILPTSFLPTAPGRTQFAQPARSFRTADGCPVPD